MENSRIVVDVDGISVEIEPQRSGKGHAWTFPKKNFFAGLA